MHKGMMLSLIHVIVRGVCIAKLCMFFYNTNYLQAFKEHPYARHMLRELLQRGLEPVLIVDEVSKVRARVY